MLLSLTRTAKLISSRDQNTGDTMDEYLMASTRKKSTKASPAFPITSMPPWCGAETARSTFTKEVNSGDSIHSSDHQSSQHIPNHSAIGKAFQMASMPLFNTPTDTPTSSKVTNIIDSMTERLL